MKNLIIALTFVLTAFGAKSQYEVQMYGDITKENVETVLMQVYDVLQNHEMDLNDYVNTDGVTPENLYEKMLELDPETPYYERLEYIVKKDGEIAFRIYVFANVRNVGFLLESEQK